MPKWTHKSVTAIPSALSVAGTLAAAVVLQAGGRLALGAPVAERRHLKMAFKGERKIRCYSVDERNTSATSNFFANVHRDFGQLDVVVIDAFRPADDGHFIDEMFGNFFLCIASAIPYANKDLLVVVMVDQLNRDFIEAGRAFLNLILAAQCKSDLKVRMSFISKSASGSELPCASAVVFSACEKPRERWRGYKMPVSPISL